MMGARHDCDFRPGPRPAQFPIAAQVPAAHFLQQSGRHGRLPAQMPAGRTRPSVADRGVANCRWFNPPLLRCILSYLQALQARAIQASRAMEVRDGSAWMWPP
jgi:hypothetical protein